MTFTEHTKWKDETAEAIRGSKTRLDVGQITKRSRANMLLMKILFIFTAVMTSSTSKLGEYSAYPKHIIFNALWYSQFGR